MSGAEEYIANQIARDAALAMALQSEEMEPLSLQLDNASYLALLHRNTPRLDLGGRDHGERAADAPQSQTLAEEWTFARPADENGTDAPLDNDNTERVLKGGGLINARATRGRCGTGFHRRRAWLSLPTD